MKNRSAGRVVYSPYHNGRRPAQRYVNARGERAYRNDALSADPSGGQYG